MELTKIQEKNLRTVIRKFIEYDLDTRDDVYYLLMGYKCFENESDKFIEHCIDEVIRFKYIDYKWNTDWR